MATGRSGNFVGNREIPPKRTTAKRVCTEPGCGAKLSTYNPDDRCSPHRRDPIRTSRGNRVRELPKIPWNVGAKRRRSP